MTTTRPAPEIPTRPVLRSAYQRAVATYWNNEKDPVNLRLGDVDGLYHHHYGIGDYDPAVLTGPAEGREQAIIAELHRLESAQAEVLLDHLGDIPRTGRLMDGGSGRGGTSFMANQRFGCQVDGVTISESQVEFANNQARERGVADQVRFHFRNMLDTGFETGSMNGIWTNETTMYVDLHDLYDEFARLIPFGGRYVCITGCYNDVTGGRSKAVSQIDQHYTCNIHPRSRYFEALADNNFVPINVVDLTAATIPYWELRAKSSVATGVEDPFLTAYREGSFHYLLIAADRI
ncbi:geranyl diphosphate 2-C-methyltransferase [Actinokineospora alba]|uniref:Geranyl diphosphate 2-C-methyltransferase n=1 Tax=Actinokineospora alba TaxID=504798 RepID=A0A1H0G6P0_9PSEU|nr:geranyl diphosphate 2-C-methyltransferase [Actinokineospora alba]TDP69784.1 geranyl diphosphate 2-C-methyltransferase [Actinokineospora alba]SDI08749.1 geranyl diphosphate 2-C-methyltransferase [Actinokineospora alba]SDO02520.1 geranyl diphosphate 2-C-methyltransferase [Actinokineospora alba]